MELHFELHLTLRPEVGLEVELHFGRHPRPSPRRFDSSEEMISPESHGREMRCPPALLSPEFYRREMLCLASRP